MTAENQEKSETFVSSLTSGREAFLAEVSAYSLAIGERSPDDFIKHFSCSAIMMALADHPEERAKILTEATSTHAKIAPRMSAEAAGETLQIALDETLTNPAQIVELFDPDDRQRYLDDAALWAFTVSGEPTATSRKGEALDRSKRFVGYVLERALHHQLIDAKELITSLTVARLTTTLPPAILAGVIEASLDASGKFSHADLVAVAPPEKLAAHVPPDYIWQKVVVPHIVERHGLASGKAAAASDDDKGSPESSQTESAEKAEDEEFEAALEAASEVVDAQELGPEEDVLLDDDDEEVHTVTDEDDVFDDLLDDGPADSDSAPGPGVKRVSDSSAKKNAAAH